MNHRATILSFNCLYFHCALVHFFSFNQKFSGFSGKNTDSQQLRRQSREHRKHIRVGRKELGSLQEGSALSVIWQGYEICILGKRIKEIAFAWIRKSSIKICKRSLFDLLSRWSEYVEEGNYDKQGNHKNPPQHFHSESHWSESISRVIYNSIVWTYLIFVTDATDGVSVKFFWPV